MKKIAFLLVIFALLGSATAWYLMNKENKRSFDYSDKDFNVEDVSTIHKIFIADRNKKANTLVRKDDHWVINDKYKVNPSSVEALLGAIEKVKVKFLPANAMEPLMVKNLATQGIKVELYNKANQKMKAYYVGGMTNNEEGTYMIMEDAERPYITHIPGWVGGLRARYRLTETQWRDKSVFSEKMEDITSVSVEYPLQKDQSFKLEKKGRNYDVQPFYQTTPKIKKEIHQGQAQAFLMNFESLIAESFENQMPKQDSVKSMVPFSIISVKKADGTEKSIKLFPIATYKNGELLTPEHVVGANSAIEKYWCDTSDGDFMLVQHLLFQKILWGYGFFFE